MFLLGSRPGTLAERINLINTLGKILPGTSGERTENEKR